ncbi:MAG: hypothetical protein BGO29_09600 [Bacteroidales bacterium 36-12]|nr:MAG: hypothetical protein BGO29_09600 [Bacteroidales bacterium 36-12]
MPGPLPPDAQPRDGAADRRLRDRDAVVVPQVAHQQRRGPDGGSVAEATGVGVDDLGDPLVDAPVPRTGAARPRGVRQALPQPEVGASLEPLHPVVDGPAADAEGVGDLLGRLALVEPQQRLGAAPLPGHRGVRGEVLQFEPLPG